jgi:hypothetical protein
MNNRRLILFITVDEYARKEGYFYPRKTRIKQMKIIVDRRLPPTSERAMTTTATVIAAKAQRLP